MLDKKYLDNLITVFVLDNADLNPLEKLSIIKKLNQLTSQIQTAKDNNEKLTTIKEILRVLEKLGVKISKRSANNADLYNFAQNRSQSKRKKDNAAAMAMLDKIANGELNATDLTAQDKEVLAKYSGCGGGLTNKDGLTGSAYEYYTPTPIAQSMWQIAEELGFKGGKVLDPCAGTGVFGATAPQNSVIDSIELDPTSSKINELVNGGVGYQAINAPFEKIATAIDDQSYDAVITNVPFGDNSARGGNQYLDLEYQDEPLQNYFILKSLKKLRPGGLALFITPPSCISGKGAADLKLRTRASYLAEFLGGFRLPNSVFKAAAADTITDIMIWRKHSQDVQEKITELKEQNIQTLIDANVLWQTFINGKFFAKNQKYILGEVTTGKNRFGQEVEKVITTNNTSEIAQTLRTFTNKKLNLQGRINYDLLDQTQSLPIVYNDGDCVIQDGQTLILIDGVFCAIDNTATTKAAKIAAANIAAKLDNPFNAFTNLDNKHITKAQVLEFLSQQKRKLYQDTPSWLKDIALDLNNLDPVLKNKFFLPIINAYAVCYVLHADLDVKDFNYLATYPQLSKAMITTVKACANLPFDLNQKTKNNLNEVKIHYTPKQGYSNVWRGLNAEDTQIKPQTAEEKIAAFRYENKSIWLTPSQMNKVYPDVDFLADDDWVLNKSGHITKAQDYYVGSYGIFLENIESDISFLQERNRDPNLINKLIRQKIKAQELIASCKQDINKIIFNIFTPYVDLDEKLQFAKQYIHSGAFKEFDEKSEKYNLNIEIKGSKLTDEDKIFKRVGAYLKNGTISLQGTKFDNLTDEEAILRIQQEAKKLNTQFNNWVKTKPHLLEKIKEANNQPQNLKFRLVDDGSALDIKGLNPNLKLHNYQNAFARNISRNFSGINAFGTGLGKTFTALASVQYAQNIGVKNKTLFIVPDDCLFIGLADNKKGYDSKLVAKDLTRILENKHRKIFVTNEGFEALKLKDATIDKYLNYLDRNTHSKDNKKTVFEEKASHIEYIRDVLNNKKTAAPYLEDLGIDSLVIDEAHFYKNSKEALTTKKAKKLSLSKASARGIDIQAKAWYIKGLTAQADGILMLTATPLTNSPLEVYSMLTLVDTEERINAACCGTRSVDEFLSVVCDIEHVAQQTITNEFFSMRTLIGLTNASMLRNILKNNVTFKEAKDVGLAIIAPEANNEVVNLTLPSEQLSILSTIKEAYKEVKTRGDNALNYQTTQTAMQLLGLREEEVLKLRSSFSLLKTLDDVALDVELLSRAFIWSVAGNKQDAINQAAAQFNALKIKEQITKLSKYTSKENYIAVEKNDIPYYEVEVTAQILKIKGIKSIVIDSLDPLVYAKFEQIAAKCDLSLSVSISPKVAAMLENFKLEQANPRGIDANGEKIPYAKQIIFCDNLAMHGKIKSILAEHTGINASEIGIITGKVANVEDIAEGFNSSDNNKYKVILANEKAEVGLNLQIGTQAIHHLTIGWTPDSLTQRNGRGVRQGNKTTRVNIYQYDADGTFDSIRRDIVESKALWIEELTQKEETESITVNAGLSEEEADAMIAAIGDKNALEAFNLQKQINEKTAQIKNTQFKQQINLNSISRAVSAIKLNQTPVTLFVNKLIAIKNDILQLAKIEQKNLSFSKKAAQTYEGSRSAKTFAQKQKYENLITNLEVQIQEKTSALEACFSGEIKTVKEVISKVTSYDPLSKIKDEVFFERIRFDDAAAATTLIIGQYPPFKKITLLKDCAVIKEQQNILMSEQNMLNQAVGDFKKLASNDAAYPAFLADLISFDPKSVAIVDGVCLVSNMFILEGEKLYLCQKKNYSDDFYFYSFMQFSDGDYREYGYKLADIDLKTAEFIYPNSAQYVDCLQQAAAKDDAAIMAYAQKNQVELKDLDPYRAPACFARHLPIVAQYSKLDFKQTIQLDRLTHKLPAPYFPYMLDDNFLHWSRNFLTAVNKTKAVAAVEIAYNQIEKNQRQVIIMSSFGGTRVYSDLAFTAITKKEHFENAVIAFCDYAKAHAIEGIEELTEADIKELTAVYKNKCLK